MSNIVSIDKKTEKQLSRDDLELMHVVYTHDYVHGDKRIGVEAVSRIKSMHALRCISLTGPSKKIKRAANKRITQLMRTGIVE